MDSLRRNRRKRQFVIEITKPPFAACVFYRSFVAGKDLLVQRICHGSQVTQRSPSTAFQEFGERLGEGLEFFLRISVAQMDETNFGVEDADG
jgi:hypothetical protein